MMHSRPVLLVLLGIALMIVGWVFPFLMVLGVIKSSFALNFLSFAAQVSGFFLGFIGAAMYVQLKKK